MRDRWLPLLTRDPYYNPNLSERFDFTLNPASSDANIIRRPAVVAR
jgi:hypothetical protein